MLRSNKFEKKFMKILNEIFKNKFGFTLIEVVLVSAILMVLVLSITPFLKSTHDAWETDKNLSKMLNDARHTMDIMTRELRAAPSIAGIDPTPGSGDEYISFGISDIILDDGDSGFEKTGTWSSNGPGEKGGYAGDYLKSSASDATYILDIKVPGNYDVYAWFVKPSASNGITYQAFDDGNGETSWSNIDQNSVSNLPKWYKLGSNNFTSGGDDEIKLTRVSGTVIADAVKLVYRGTGSKTFYYDDVGKNLYFRATSEANSSDNLLLSGINNLIFGFYQADGVTPATSNENLSIIRIAITLSDPNNKAPDLVLQTEVELRTKNVRTKSLIVNEIVYGPSPPTIFFFDDFDGNVIVNGEPVGSIQYVYYNSLWDNGDNGWNNWTNSIDTGKVAAPWQVGTPTEATSGPDTTSPGQWNPNLAGNYAKNCGERIISAPFVATASSVRWAELKRAMIRSSDYIYFYYRVYPSGSWTSFGSFTNKNETSFSIAVGDLSLTVGTQYQVAYRMYDNDDTLQRSGYVIDQLTTNYSRVTVPPFLWEIGIPANVGPATCYSGARCLGTQITKNYLCMAMEASIVTPSIDLTGAINPMLQFYHYRNFEGTTSNYDGGIIEISTNSTNGIDGDWTQLTTTNSSLDPDYNAAISKDFYNPLKDTRAYCHDSTSWTPVTADLTNWAGNSNVRIRFRFGSDEYQGGWAPGWYIDNIKIFGNVYQYIELYNPTPYSIDLLNYRIITEQSLRDVDDDGAGADVAGFDKILAYSAGSTVIQPNRFAIVAANGSHLYTAGSPYKTYIDARVSAGDTIRLEIADRIFGLNHLNSDYGKITIQDTLGNIIDYLGYNLAFYDDMESAATIGLWSARTVAGTTAWGRGSIVAGDNLTNNNDNTRGTATGSVYGTNLGANYADSSTSDLITPAVEYTNITPTLSFYHKFRIAAGDTAVVQQSTDGGASWTDLGASFGVGISTGWWDRVTRELTVNAIGMLRFRFTSDAATSDTGWYIDDVAVYWSWGAAPGSNRSLERINYQGTTSIRENWAESTNLIDNTAPIPDVYGTPGGRNSVSP